MELRKIPLGPFIEILTDLFESGADFIDLSGSENTDGETPRDSIKITVKPEYLSNEEEEEEEDNDLQEFGREIQIDINDSSSSTHLSDDDINELME